MVPDLSDLPLALLKQYSQGKDRWHSAALTDVSDWTPHLDQLVPTASSTRNPDMNTNHFLGISEEPKGALYEILWSCLYPKGYRTLSGKH